MNDIITSRRNFLQASSALTLSAAATAAYPMAVKRKRPRVAAIFTEFRFRSHAYNILENFFAPYLFRGKLVDPGVDVVSFYADQIPKNDMARDVAKKHDVGLYPSIAAALQLGTKKLAVDAVLLIGEHGEYPVNALGQKMYPRKRFFDETAAVVAKSGKTVPVFNDKHLSYRWDWSRQMYDVSRRLKMPLLAGSSVPLAERRPRLELQRGAEIEEAISVHGGGLESYDFHGLEVLFSMIEGRRGGESGVTKVELLTGDRLKKAIMENRWSPALLEAAWQAERKTGIIRQPRPGQKPDNRQPLTQRPQINHALCLTHADGLKSTVLAIGNNSNRWSFACRLKGRQEPLATFFYNGPWGNRCLFKALSHAIQRHFIQRRAPYPVERTLLGSGILVSAMQSHRQRGAVIATPHLKIPYSPRSFDRYREDGSTWKIITSSVPQPADFSPGDRKFVK